MATIFRTGGEYPLTFNPADGIITDHRGMTAHLDLISARNLAFTLDLLEKYEETEVGNSAMYQAIQTAFAFWED